MKTKDLSETLAVVSGGTRGIGLALVQGFLKAGMHVATCSRSSQHVESLRKTHASSRLDVFSADLSQREGVRSFVREIHALKLPISVLVNNVGNFVPAYLKDEPEGQLESLMATNLYSAYWLSRDLIPKFISQKFGHIFNINSVAGLQAYPQGGSYSISKFAMRGLGLALRAELKEYGIRVTNIFPGAVLTDSWKGTTLPSSRFMRPEDIANMVWQSLAVSERSNVEDIILRPVGGDL
ncbi:MAG: SDR family NAD(P)-dependent oxidoreductase [Cytophagales bacterium]|nr:SDR family NAD(P)-dependent oxidoreductase [Cytophagales bacterium]